MYTHRNRVTCRHTDVQGHRLAQRHPDVYRCIQTHPHLDTWIDTADRFLDRDTWTHTHMDTEMHRYTHRHTGREFHPKADTPIGNTVGCMDTQRQKYLQHRDRWRHTDINKHRLTQGCRHRWT